MRNLPSPSQADPLGLPASRDDQLGYPTRPVSAMGSGANLHTYLRLLKRRKWMILIPLVVILPVVAAWLFLQRPLYEATVTLLIEPRSDRVVDIDEVKGPDRSFEYYTSQYALLRSQALIGRTVEALGVIEPEPDTDSWVARIRAYGGVVKAKLDEWKEAIRGKDLGEPMDRLEVLRREQIAHLREMTRVEPVGTRLVNVTTEGPDPSLITRQVNTLAQVYVEQNLATKVGASEQASTWLTEKVEELKADLSESELELQDFIERHKLIPTDLGERPLVELEEYKSLSSAYAELKANRVEVEAQLSEMNRAGQLPFERLAALAAQIENPFLAALRDRHAALEVARVELLENVKPKHPKVLALEAKMRQVQQRIAQEIKKYATHLKSESAVMAKKIAIFDSRIGDKKGEIIRSNEDLEQYADLKRNIASKRKLYENLLNRMNETEVTKSLQSNNVRIFQEALTPVEPKPRRVWLKFLISAVVTLSLGVGMAFAAEMIDSRFKNLDDVEVDLQIPFLGLVPSYSTKRLQGLIAMEQPRSAVADSYRILRTNLQMIVTQRQLTTLMVTSAVAGEGKTTTTSNLGVSFAQLGWRVLLIDADLRRPALHRAFQIDNAEGLSDVLSGEREPKELLQDVGVQNLRIMASGPVPPNPAELLNESRLRVLCDQVQDDFDLIIFDSAITLSIPDTLLMAPAVGGVCLVHNPDRGDKGGVETAKKMLDRAQAHIVGIMFNNVRLKTSGYGDYHYYSSTYTVEDVKRLD